MRKLTKLTTLTPSITRRVLITAMCLMPPVFLASQQPRDAAVIATTGTAQIAGAVVTDDADAAPVRRATMKLGGGSLGSSLLIATTDDAGRFAFTSLPAGRYSLSAAKGGYLPLAYGSKRAGGTGTPLAVGDGQQVSGLTMRLLKGSVITGTVRDERGRPVPDVTVSALQEAWDYTTGKRTIEGVSGGARQVTDDRGVYRIYGLAPGNYMVSASSPQRLNADSSSSTSSDIRQITVADFQRAQQLVREAGDTSVFRSGQTASPPPRARTVASAPVYYPAASDVADAATITLGPHEERSGVDVQLRLMPTARIEGVTIGPDGAPLAGVKLQLIDPGPSPNPGVVRVFRNARSEPDGKFVIAGVPPGRYTISAFGAPAYMSSVGGGGVPGAVVWGVTEVHVDGVDVTTSIALSLGERVSGRVVFDGTSSPPDVTAVPLVLQQLPPLSSRSGEMSPDGTFVFTNVAPGAYRMTLRGYAPVGWMGWMLKSVLVGGVEVSDIPLEIKPNEPVDGAVVTFTDRHTEISGTLQTAAGQPASNYVLIVYSADKRFWVAQTRRTRQIRPGVDGTFIIRDLPPGEYFMSALTDVEDEQWNSPAFLADLATHQPIKVTLGDGEKTVQNIRVGGG